MAGHAETSVGMHGHRWRMAGWAMAALLLLLPLITMLVTHEVAWDGADFAIFGAMLLTVGGAYELTVRMTRSTACRTAIGVVLVATFLLVWAELAVGIFR